MKIQYIVLSVFALLTLTSCSLDKKRIDYKSTTSSVTTLEVPPDLTSPSANEQYVIPGSDGILAANYSDYAKDAAAKPEKGAVLPEFKNVRLEKNGNQRWLVVSNKAENVWPSVKSFWLEMGFNIQVENPTAGVMETDWQENSGNIPQHLMRGALGNGKILDTLKPAGQRDQYLTRIERSKDGQSTEIFITQHAMEEIQLYGKRNSKWLTRASNTEVEAAVLQMLMSKIGLSSVVPSTTKTAMTTASTLISVQIKEDAGRKIIQLSEPFDKSWRKVGLAIDKSKMIVEDKNREAGIYFLRLGPKVKKSNYQVVVREHDALSDISVQNIDGTIDTESTRILETLFQNIEK